MIKLMETTKHKIIDGKLELTSTQLELILTLLEVERLPGATQNRFLNNREDGKHSEWESSIEELSHDGWLFTDTEGKRSINPGLIRVVLNMASAPHVIILNITQKESSQGIVQYFGKEMIVEMANGPSSHHITLLESQEIALNRLCHYAEIPSDGSADDEQIVLSPAEVEQLEMGNLTEKTPPAPLFQELQTSWKNPTIRGDLALLTNKWEGGYSGLVYGIVVGTNSAWGTTSNKSGHATYKKIGKRNLLANLTSFLDE